MEAFNDMMKNFIDMQQKTFGLLYENTKTPMDYIADYATLMDSSAKFHKAAVKYHESIIEMIESTKEITNIYKTRK